jgi:hypothetical protein
VTTYATPPLLLAPDAALPPQPQPHPVGQPKRGRLAWASAWLAVAVCGAAAAISGFTLAQPTARPVHTVLVSPTFTTEQIAAAKKQACAAWDVTATKLVAAATDVADAPRGWNDPVKREAVAAEARAILVEIAYLRTQLSAATPPELTIPIHEYVVASFDQENATLHLKGSARNEAIDRGNAAAGRVDAVCGSSP